MKYLEARLSKKQEQNLEDLMDELGIQTTKDLLNNALTLFEWAVQERKSGNIIVSMEESSQMYKELTMPCFPRISMK